MQKLLLTNKETYTMELEQTCVHKTSQGADHLANGKLFATAALYVTVVQKSPCAVLRSFRKGNGL